MAALWLVLRLPPSCVVILHIHFLTAGNISQRTHCQGHKQARVHRMLCASQDKQPCQP
jgi:hypothetical protein